jgi:hypothetical protein
MSNLATISMIPKRALEGSESSQDNDGNASHKPTYSLSSTDQKTR